MARACRALSPAAERWFELAWLAAEELVVLASVTGGGARWATRFRNSPFRDVEAAFGGVSPTRSGAADAPELIGQCVSVHLRVSKMKIECV